MTCLWSFVWGFVLGALCLGFVRIWLDWFFKD